MKKTNLPVSSGGIVQYFDDTASKTNLTPNQVIVLTLVLIILVVMLRLTNIFGF
ncbi:MAG: preprotein translocase subunit Sec61beta [Nanoarchaeota archaeon]|nr:preprotein translocase subunit Sec61beta [Nanoarchaeota archaeon]